MTEQEIKDRIANNLCLECGKPITDDSKLFCQDCYESSMKKVIENCFNGNDWVWVLILLGIFSGKGEEFSNKTLKEQEDKKDKEYSLDIKIALRDAISKLKEKEKYILIERYLIGKTQMELAQEIGISQAQISRLEKSGLDNVKKMIK